MADISSHMPHYRICILAYSRVTAIAREVIAALPDKDIEYIVLESGLDEEQEACVREARRLGCEVFIAGPAGAALFTSRHSYPMVPFRVRSTDYLTAIRTAMNDGAKTIGIARYRYAAPVRIDLYEELMQVSLKEIVYEEIPELYEKVKAADCDAFIGPAALEDAAEAAGKPSVLVYAGREAIRKACLEAADLIRKLYASNRSQVIAQSLLNTTQLGIIITDAENKIEFFNRTMQTYTGLVPHQVSGRPLTEIFANLQLETFLQSGFNLKDSFHLINGTMMRCVFRRLTVGKHAGGVLISFHPMPHGHA